MKKMASSCEKSPGDAIPSSATYTMPPTPPSAEATPNDIVLYRDRCTPDTAALVSLSRIARMARPGRLLIRFATIQKQIAPTTVKMKNFQMRSASFDDRSLVENYAAALEEIVRLKPAAAKGRYLRKITFTTTMGPGILVDPARTRGLTDELEEAAAAS